VRFTVGHPVLRRLAALLGLLNFFYFATEAVLVLYTFQRLHAGKAVYTALFVAAAAGTLATQAVVSPVQNRIGSVPTIVMAFWLWALALVGLAVTSRWPVAVALFFMLGMGDGFWRVLTVTLRQTMTPNRLLGRVNSAYRMVAQGVIPLGAAFGGIVAKSFGIRAPFVVAAVVFVVIAAWGPVLLRPAGAK
jgi:predicted MFS family arabinose efflux permease